MQWETEMIKDLSINRHVKNSAQITGYKRYEEVISKPVRIK